MDATESNDYDRDLDAFLEYLKFAGLDFQVDQIACANHLLISSLSRNRVGISALRFEFSAIFSKSPLDQEKFSRAFDYWVDWKERIRVEGTIESPNQSNNYVYNFNIHKYLHITLYISILIVIVSLSFVNVPSSINTINIDIIEALTTPDENKISRVPALIPLIIFLASVLSISFFGFWISLQFSDRRRRRFSVFEETFEDEALMDALLARSEAFSDLYSSASRSGFVDYSAAVRKISLPRTIQATVKAGGLFTPVYGQKVEEQAILFLIDRRSYNDHLALSFEQVLQAVRSHYPTIEVFHYDTDARIVWKPEPNRREYTIPALADQFEGWNLAIVGSPSQMFSQVDGRKFEWTEVFRRWKSRTLLNTRPIVGWSGQEHALLNDGFSLATASTLGLQSFAEAIKSGTLVHKPQLLEGRVRSTLRNFSKEFSPQPSDIRFIDFVFRDAPEAPALVPIAPGSFAMSGDELVAASLAPPSRTHVVTISEAFAIGQYPVTVREYAYYCFDTGITPTFSVSKKMGGFPIIFVCWSDAVSYCKWLSHYTGKKYRLPTEAEWEFTCRAGTVTKYPWGDDWAPFRANGNSIVGDTTWVGSYPPNAWKLYDMLGNTWEWCADNWQDDLMTRRVQEPNIILGSIMRVARGGSWGNSPPLLVSSSRTGFPEDHSSSIIGFRVVRELPTLRSLQAESSVSG